MRLLPTSSASVSERSVFIGAGIAFIMLLDISYEVIHSSPFLLALSPQVRQRVCLEGEELEAYRQREREESMASKAADK